MDGKEEERAGGQIPGAAATCAGCGKGVEADAAFCPSCGHALKGKAA
jgi:rRNA maturation endonuclease Nob1